MASSAPSMTPRALAIEAGARSVARDRGDDYVGVEHLFLTMLDDEGSLPADVLRSLGVLEATRQALLERLASPPEPSNWVADEEGVCFGYLVDDPLGVNTVVDAVGRRLIVERTQEGETLFRYPDGTPAEPLASDAPRLSRPQVQA